jgi:uncharacterized protein
MCRDFAPARYCLALVLTVCLCSCGNISSPGGLALEEKVNSRIAAEIKNTRVIDNHAHPTRNVAAGEARDRDFDALPGDSMEDPALPAPMRPDNPAFTIAWRELFDYGYKDSTEAHLKSLREAKQRIAAAQGERYPTWVLNKTGTDIMLANRIAMGKSLPNDRFKWVPFADMFLFPLNNESFYRLDSDHRAFVGSEERLLKKQLADVGMATLPATFDEYLTFISHVLEQWKSNGAVALKFEFAYLRDLQIDNPSREAAERVYAIYARSSEPTTEEYKTVQDFLFRYIALEAGRLELPVHIHCASGIGSYFRTPNGNPLALESLFDDPRLRKTKFVLLHGGWPFTKEAASMTLKPNVYVDTSGLLYFAYPTEVAQAMRNYLETAPEKVLFGTDASPLGGEIGWEETAWTGTRFGRLALGLALTGMVQDGEITEVRAKELAKMVLRENARGLYRF